MATGIRLTQPRTGHINLLDEVEQIERHTDAMLEYAREKIEQVSTKVVDYVKKNPEKSALISLVFLTALLERQSSKEK